MNCEIVIGYDSTCNGGCNGAPEPLVLFFFVFFWCAFVFHVAGVGNWEGHGLQLQGLCKDQIVKSIWIECTMIFNYSHSTVLVFVCEYRMTYFPFVFPAFWWFLCVGLIKWSCRSCGKVFTWLLDLHSIYIVQLLVSFLWDALLQMNHCFQSSRAICLSHFGGCPCHCRRSMDRVSWNEEGLDWRSGDCEFVKLFESFQLLVPDFFLCRSRARQSVRRAARTVCQTCMNYES